MWEKHPRRFRLFLFQLFELFKKNFSNACNLCFQQKLDCIELRKHRIEQKALFKLIPVLTGVEQTRKL